MKINLNIIGKEFDILSGNNFFEFIFIIGFIVFKKYR